jgi:hypothetical protein
VGRFGGPDLSLRILRFLRVLTSVWLVPRIYEGKTVG